MAADAADSRAYLEGLCARAENVACETRFLSSEQAVLLAGMARARGLRADVNGGWPEAERVVMRVAPPDDLPDAPPPVSCLLISWDRRAPAPEHRDLLGAALALGLDRSVLGDIVVSEHSACLFVTPPMAQRVADTLLQAGRTRLTVRVGELPPGLRASPGIPVRLTAASLRLDCVIAALDHLSRAEAAERVSRGAAQVNHVAETRPDRRISPGDIVTVRGQGRFVLDEARPNRRERLVLTGTAYGRFAVCAHPVESRPSSSEWKD